MAHGVPLVSIGPSYTLYLVRPQKQTSKLLKVKKISFFMDGYLDLVIFYLTYIGYQYL